MAQRPGMVIERQRQGRGRAPSWSRRWSVVLGTLSSPGQGMAIWHGHRAVAPGQGRALSWSSCWPVVPGTLSSSGHGVVTWHGIEHRHQEWASAALVALLAGVPSMKASSGHGPVTWHAHRAPAPGQRAGTVPVALLAGVPGLQASSGHDLVTRHGTEHRHQGSGQALSRSRCWQVCQACGPARVAAW